MVLRINDKPKFVDNPVRIDPYEEVMRALNGKDYDKIKDILTGKTHPRDISVFPTALLHIDSKQYDVLIEHAKKDRYIAELCKCFRLAKDLACQFNDAYDAGVESALERMSDCPEPTSYISSFPRESFEHSYDVYRK